MTGSPNASRVARKRRVLINEPMVGARRYRRKNLPEQIAPNQVHELGSIYLMYRGFARLIESPSGPDQTRSRLGGAG